MYQGRRLRRADTASPCGCNEGPNDLIRVWRASVPHVVGDSSDRRISGIALLLIDRPDASADLMINGTEGDEVLHHHLAVSPEPARLAYAGAIGESVWVFTRYQRFNADSHGWPSSSGAISPHSAKAIAPRCRRLDPACGDMCKQPIEDRQLTICEIVWVLEDAAILRV